jgi:hypothetical protein
VTSSHPSFRDFTIRCGAETGACGSKGSFRAIRRRDGMPVLLHRFPPATDLISRRPILTDSVVPDFPRPFLTRFIGLLPQCAPMMEVWRALLSGSFATATSSTNPLWRVPTIPGTHTKGAQP